MENLTFNELPQAVTQLCEDMAFVKQLLLNKSNELQTETEQLLTIKQAGEFLKLTVPTLYGYVHRADIPVCKRGKRLYFSKQDLSNWIREGKRKTITEISAEADLYLSKNKRR